MTTLVKAIYLRMNEYGADKGKLSGDIEFLSPSGEIKVRIGQAQAEKIIAILADELVNTARETASLMTQQIVEQARNGTRMLEG